MNYLRISLYILIGILVALLAGFLWGRAGRSALQVQAGIQELAMDVAEARASLLAARVDLFEVNFGEASRELAAARSWLQQGATRASAIGQDDNAARLKNVAARLDQTQQQIARLDQSANTTLAEAIRLLVQVAPAGRLEEER